MRIVYMGTPEFAAAVLAKLASEHDIISVYTRPDAASGRGKALLPSPVRKLAEELGVCVHTPRDFYLRDGDGRPVQDANGRRLASGDLLEQLQAAQADVIVVAAYGVILPEAVLGAAPLGAVNVHASLLPRWRGAAPIQRAILAGDAELGVCIMRMTPGLDEGPYCASASLEAGDKSASQLSSELAELGAGLLLEQLPAIEDGSAVWTQQQEKLACYAEKVAKQEVMLAPGLQALENLRRVRASSPQAPARCILAGRTVTVLAAKPVCGTSAAAQGTAAATAAQGAAAAASQGAAATAAQGCVAISGKRLLLGCADGALEATELKPDGKQAMAAAAFVNGIAKLSEQELHWEGL